MAAFLCDKCKTPLPGASVNTGGNLVACPACGTALLAQVFPAFAQGITRGRIGDLLASEEDAGCFQHPARKANAACALCGRFLCALCDLDLGGRDVCPVCVESARNTPSGLLTGNQRVLHDKLALLLTLVSVVIALAATTAPEGRIVLKDNQGHVIRRLGHPDYNWFVFIVAPAACSLYFSVRYRQEPAQGPVPRTRAWLLIAGGLAGSALLLTAMVIAFTIYEQLHS